MTAPQQIVVTLFDTLEVALASADPADVAQTVLSDIYRGPPGGPGPAGSIALEIEQVAVDGVNTITAPGAFSFSRLYINGLRQQTGSYTIAGNVITLPLTLNCVAGDILVFEYLPT